MKKGHLLDINTEMRLERLLFQFEKIGKDNKELTSLDGLQGCKFKGGFYDEGPALTLDSLQQLNFIINNGE